MKNLTICLFLAASFGCATQRNAYTFVKGDTVYDNATGARYIIVAQEYHPDRPNIHYYTATNIATGQRVTQLLERVLTK